MGLDLKLMVCHDMAFKTRLSVMHSKFIESIVLLVVPQLGSRVMHQMCSIAVLSRIGCCTTAGLTM